jgi:dihydroorotase
VTESVDLLIAGGTVLDPASGLEGPRDVAVRDGRIVAIEPTLPRAGARQLLDATGCYVAPGFIDLHTHVYWGVNYFGVEADPLCTATGVTTVVDCGSAGAVNFPGLRRYVVDTSRTRILAFVNVAQHGIQRTPATELRDLAYADPEGAAEQAQRHADVTVGIKVRMGVDMVADNGREALRLALRSAEMANTRLMVHIGGSAVPVEEIVDSLRPGDVVTHCFNGLDEAIVDERGTLRPAVLRAHERGVLFDLGHAGGMFAFDVARAALAQGLRPDALSTDAHVGLLRPGAREPGFGLPTVLTKFLALGWSLNEVVAACTIQPARAIGWDDRLGRLAVGREADVTVFRLRDGPVTLLDARNATVEGDRAVEPLWTIRAGEPLAARGQSGSPLTAQ